MINLYVNRSDRPLGVITEDQLQFLVDSMEEESTTDQDYYLDAATLGYLQARGAHGDLVAILQAALGDEQEVTIRWNRE